MGGVFAGSVVAFSHPWARAGSMVVLATVAPALLCWAGAKNARAGGLAGALAGFTVLIAGWALLRTGSPVELAALAGAATWCGGSMCRVALRWAPAAGPLIVFGCIAGPSVAPFLLAQEASAAGTQQFAARLFESSLVAACAHGAGFDLLRNDVVYRHSVLGSSVPVGYPSGWLFAAVLTAGGTLMYLMAPALTGRTPANPEPTAIL
jgi:hypothetical protein